MYKNTIDKLDQIIKNSFHDDNSVAIYRVGSSIYHPLDKIGDIDYLLVKQCYSDVNLLKLNKLIEHFYLRDVQNYSFCSLNKKQMLLLKSKIERFGFNPVFKFGPSSSNIHNIKQVHIAGPLSILEMNFFFDFAPLFLKVFYNHNIRLNGQPFSELFHDKKATVSDLKNNIKGVLSRVGKEASLTQKRKVLKRIILIYHVYRNSRNPYDLSDKLINSISNAKVDILISKILTLANSRV